MADSVLVLGSLVSCRTSIETVMKQFRIAILVRDQLRDEEREKYADVREMRKTKRGTKERTRENYPCEMNETVASNWRGCRVCSRIPRS